MYNIKTLMMQSTLANNRVPGYSDKRPSLNRLKWVRRLAHLLDNSIRIPGLGYRIGLDPVMGLIPGLGDVVGGILSAYIVYEAYRLGIPARITLRMLFNVGVEVLIGAVPIAGDIFDAGWKANAKNIALMDEYFNDLNVKTTISRV